LAVLLQGAASVVIAQSEYQFYKRANVPEAAKLDSREHFFSDPHVRQTGKKNWNII
jgi:hypothetical protein